MRKDRRLATADILFFTMGALTYFTFQAITRDEVAHIQQAMIDALQLPGTQNLKKETTTPENQDVANTSPPCGRTED